MARIPSLGEIKFKVKRVFKSVQSINATRNKELGVPVVYLTPIVVKFFSFPMMTISVTEIKSQI